LKISTVHTMGIKADTCVRSTSLSSEVLGRSVFEALHKGGVSQAFVIKHDRRQSYMSGRPSLEGDIFDALSWSEFNRTPQWRILSWPTQAAAQKWMDSRPYIENASVVSASQLTPAQCADASSLWIDEALHKGGEPVYYGIALRNSPAEFSGTPRRRKDIFWVNTKDLTDMRSVYAWQSQAEARAWLRRWQGSEGICMITPITVGASRLDFAPPD
jgi:hypothetical protein